MARNSKYVSLPYTPHIFILFSIILLPWLSKPAHAQTVMVKDIYTSPGAPSQQDFYSFASMNGILYFFSGASLYRSDGTEVGTYPVKYDNAVLPPWSNIVVNGELFFDGHGTSELWKSDGTTNGTVLVKGNQLNPRFLTDVNGTVFLAGWDAVNGRELWKTNGTEAGTVLVKDIMQGSGSSNPGGPNPPQRMIKVNGLLFFTADNGTHGVELWKSDGTDAGTVMVKDIVVGTGSPDIQNMTEMSGTLFFSANDGLNGNELWKSDGSESGTIMVKDIHPTNSSSPIKLINVNGTLFFGATDGAHGCELWRSDGTTLGTTMVKDINPFAGSVNTNSGFTDVDGTLFFSGLNSLNGSVNLWKSDGTEAGTVLVKDFYGGVANDTVFGLKVCVKKFLYFVADEGINGRELWRSDGTTAGTFRVKDIFPGASGSSPSWLTNVNGTLFFQANDGTHGYELWKSDQRYPGDHSGDGKADILFRHPSTGDVYLWLMNGSTP